LTLSGFVVASESRDAAIYACVAATADRWWAMGERGQALLSENAGRSWTQATLDGSPNIYAGIALDERNGVIVGGTVQPYSHRSAGVVQTTQDGGRRWREIPSEGLSRLTGIQKIGARHWIVWGDWSPFFHTALFETIDGGTTWKGKELAASHIQTAAWKDASSGIVVDRLGRVFRFEAGKQPMLLDIGGNASNRILKAAYDGSGWWLIGQSGQIYYSPNGYQWQQKQLPGNATDHALIRLSDIAFQRVDSPASSKKRCWLIGSPGSVIWTSDDFGNSWQTQATSQSMPLNSIASVGNDTLFAGGGLATIIGTRNAGEGWWILGQEGSRLALLSLTAVQANIPWDALAIVARESRAHAGGIIFHSERTYERALPWCDSETRATILASELGLSSLDTINHFPVGSLPNSRLGEEFAAYDSTLQQPGFENLIDRIAIHAIRQNRPDVIVCDSFNSDGPLAHSAARMVMTARNRASDSRYACFSKESGIPDKAWDCKTLLTRSRSDARSDRRRSELQLTSTTPVHREGMLLGEVLVAVGGQLTESEESNFNVDSFGAREESMPPWEQFGDYTVVFGSRPSGGKSSLLPDEIRQPGSMRPSSATDSLRYQSAVASFQRENNLKKLVDLEVETATRDSRWHAALNQFINSTSPAARSHSLWTVAQEARRRGHWDRWSVCLDLLVGDYSKEGAAELAVIQRAVWGGSSELRLWQQRLTPSNDLQTASTNVVTASYQSNASSSPFDNSKQETPTFKNAVTSMREIRSPSRSTLQSQAASRIVNPVTPSLSVSPKVGVSPNVQGRESTKTSASETRNANQETHFSSMTSVARIRMEFDPRKVLLDLASRAEVTADWRGIYGWSHLADQEYMLRASSVARQRSSTSSNDELRPLRFIQGPAGLMTIPLSKFRPILDGSLGDEVWKEAYQIELQSVGALLPNNQPVAPDATLVKLIRDSRFLYVAGSCVTRREINENKSIPRNPSEKKPSEKNPEGRTHDQPTPGSDRFTLRVDTDRDFLTWFQFTVDSEGNLTDSLNDMGNWNPRWYVATDRTESGWVFEFAIPLNEISDENSVKNANSEKLSGEPETIWNFAMCRTAPGQAVQQAKPLMIEEFSAVSWIPGIIQR